jgi:hypothetical protein
MAPRDDLRETADALDGSVVVCGVGSYADALAGQTFPNARFVTVAELLADDAPAVAAAVVAVDPTAIATPDGADGDAASDPLQALTAIDAFTVAVVPGGDADADELSALAERVDAVLIVDSESETPATAGSNDSPESVAIGDAIRSFLAVVQEPGFVNLDLTDAQTVLSSGIAALGTGTAASEAPAAAVEAAFDDLPEEVDPANASAVLVDVVVDPVTSISAATDVIAAVRERIETDANVIWGGAVDESAIDEIRVRIVVADVRYAPSPTAGDPCPRCGVSLSAYAFGTRETLSCDACGYSGIAMRRK